MTERIQKILASAGVGSRRYAEKLIADGRVSCNGKVCVLGQTADTEQDEILLDGKKIPSAMEHVYIMLNKPKGYVTTLSDEFGRKNAAELVADCGKRVYPVGRLDKDSEGLLLFTNDGIFANLLMHPKHEIDKVYRVTVTEFSPQALQRMSEPMTLDGYRLKKPEVRILHETPDGNAELEIVIHEGRNRQIRRMCAICGMKVRKLTRIAEDNLHLGNLPYGKWRYLTQEEVELLRK